MGVVIVLLSLGIFIGSPTGEPVDKEPGCTVTELKYLIQLEIPEDKIIQICEE